MGLEAMLRLYTEEEQNDRAFLALTRFLDALDARATQPGRRPALDPLVLSFQLKLLWIEGFCRTSRAASSAERTRRSSRSCRRPAARCAPPATRAGSASRRAVSGVCVALLGAPIADAPTVRLDDRAARDVLAVVTSSYEHHGGFRLRTLAS